MQRHRIPRHRRCANSTHPLFFRTFLGRVQDAPAARFPDQNTCIKTQHPPHTEDIRTLFSYYLLKREASTGLEKEAVHGTWRQRVASKKNKTQNQQHTHGALRTIGTALVQGQRSDMREDACAHTARYLRPQTHKHTSSKFTKARRLPPPPPPRPSPRANTRLKRRTRHQRIRNKQQQHHPIVSSVAKSRQKILPCSPTNGASKGHKR